MAASYRLCATILSLLTLCLVGQDILAQDLWRPYTEIEGRAGNRRELGTFELFVPLRQDSGSMLFLNARGFQDDLSAAEGNWGLAYRTVISNEWIFGVNGFFDYRHTEFDNEFSQGGFGLELLDVNRGFRFNGYIPDGDVKRADRASVAVVDGGTIAVRPGLEASYYGLDFEAERLLWFSGNDLELWGAAGVFHFDNNGTGFEDITGPRLRTELRMFDVPLLGNDSRLVFAGQYEHDDVRGSQGTGMVTVRIPFGPGGGRNGRRLSGLARRMVAPIERDVDIVTNAAAVGALEAAKVASSTTGNAISNVTFIDASTPDAEAVIEGAGADSVVVADGSAGTILPPGTIDMNTGQVLMGGGSGLAVVGCDTGAPATFMAPGTRPTIDSGANTAFTMADDSSLIGLDSVTNGGGALGVQLNNDTNVLLQDVGITTNGGGGLGILVDGTSQFTLVDSSVTTSSGGALGIAVGDDSQFTISDSTITTSDGGAIGVSFSGDTQGTISGTEINTSGGGAVGILSSDNGQATITDTNITTTGDGAPGIAVGSNSQITATDVNISTDGADSYGIEVSSTAEFTLNDSTITTSGNDAHGVQAADTSGFTLNNVTIDTTAGNGDGIRSESTGTFAVNDSTIMADDDVADGISVDGSTFSVNRSTIIVTEDDGIDAANANYTVNDSTIIVNGGGSTGDDGIDGGGSQFTITNSTITVNNGGEAIDSSSDYTIINSTLTSDSDQGIFLSGNTVLLDGVTINSAQESVFISGSGTVNLTITNSTINSGAGFNTIDANALAGQTTNLSATGNILNGGAGTINLNETVGGDINVTQDAPGSGAGGIDSLNNIPTANVLVPGDAIDFNQPPPTLP